MSKSIGSPGSSSYFSPAQATESNPALLNPVARKRAEAEKVAEDFETMFVDMVVKSMRQTAQPEDVSNAEDIFQGMLDSEYSKSMTSANNFGIREQILNWMEQADPSIRTPKNSPETTAANNATSNISSNNGAQKSDPQSVDSIKLQNEMWALKAASQAYRLSNQPR